MDEYGLQSQQRTAAAYEAGKYADELVDGDLHRITWDKETGEASEAEVTVTADEGVRATTAEGLAGLKTVIEGGTITAGNASQLSDGSSAQVVMDAKLAEQKGPGAPGHLPRHGRGRPVSPTRWASARSTRYPSCSSSTGCPWTISACGS